MTGLSILAVKLGPDTGGQGGRLAQAFRRYAPDWLFRSMSKAGPFNYPQDLPFRHRTFEEHYQRADVIHVRNDFALYDQAAKKFGPKPVVLHVHGTKYRGNPEEYVRQARERGALILCSTLDLYLLAPDISVWLPAPYDVDALAAMR